MAHQIENMLYVGATPWHKLGTRLEAPPTVADGIRAAGLDWTVRLDPLQTADGRVTDHNATVRSTDNKVLGVVGPQYRPLQNVDAFGFFDAFLAAGAADLHTAGSLCEGRRVWVLAKIRRDPLVIAAGDEVESYILLSNSHDGTLAVRVGFTPIRVVCANTLAMAHTDGAGKLIRVRHTAAMRDNLDAIRNVMDAAHQQFTATAEQYRRLASRHINQADVRRYVKQVFGVKEEDALSTRMSNILADVERCFTTGRGNDLPAVRGTLWTAYNAVTEYLSYGRGASADSRLNSLWFGDSANVSKAAFEAALAMAV